MLRSTEEKLLASKSWRRARAHNSREEVNLQKEKCRLDRRVGREMCQLRAAQNRFELQYYGKNSAIERKNSMMERTSSLVLPPVSEGNDRDLLKLPRERRMSKSLDSLPPIAMDSPSLPWSLNGALKRSNSVNSASNSDQALSSYSDDPPRQVVLHRRTQSYAEISSRTNSTSWKILYRTTAAFLQVKYWQNSIAGSYCTCTLRKIKIFRFRGSNYP